MASNELEEILRDFNLGDYVLLEGSPKKLYKIYDIIDNSPVKEPYTEDYDIVLVDIKTQEEVYVTKKEVIKLQESQQRLAKLIYD